ncbi:hypothetical protein [Mucilaginibacter hurinus]|nr:hypothetical protein [Mucilaginibacter hurinus]
MKRILLAAIIVSTSILTSCKKEDNVKPAVPFQTLIGFKKDISTAD